jgi:sarcosine oxidase, subunit beta
MRQKADAVIIGGGIVGAAVAFYLAKAKYGQIVLVDKEPFLGSWATGKAAGGIRAQFSTRVNIEMSMLSERLFRQFADDTGSPALFEQVGYLFLISNERDLLTFKKSYELQRSLGLPVEKLSVDEIPRYAPHVRRDDILMATICREDGLGDPHEFLSGYDRANRKMGVDVELETAVTDLIVAGGKITTVRTNRGDISTPLVINCAGPFASEIGKMIGVDIPVAPLKRQIVTTAPQDFVKPFFPMVVDVASGLYCHKESGGMLLGWADKTVKPSYDVSIDPAYTDGILERALDRIPALADAEIAGQWAGLYETTPDHHAIIGWEPSVSGVFHVTGFSGHGFMHAPGAGLVTAEMICGKPMTIDVSSLSPTRFAAGVAVEEINVI